MVRRRAVTISLILVIALSLSMLSNLANAFFIPSLTHDAQLVRIGVVTPGENEDVWALIGMAEDDINEYMNDNALGFSFDFLIEQAQDEWSVHLEKIQALKVLEGVDLIIGGGWSSMALTSLNYINENDILLLSPSASSPELSIQGDNLFRLAPPDNQQVTAIAETLRSQGIEAIVVLQVDLPWADTIFEDLMEEFGERGGLVLNRIVYPQGETDFSDYFNETEEVAAVAVEQHGVDKVGVQVISLWEAEDIVKQSAGYTTIYSLDWFGTDATAENAQILAEAAEEAAHIKLYSPKIAKLDSPEFLDLEDRFEKVAGRYLDFYGANWYDAAWVYALSVVEAGSVKAMDVKEVLRDVASVYEGVTGFCTLNEAGDRYVRDYDLWCYGYERGNLSFIDYGEFSLPMISEITCGALPTALNVGWSLNVSGSIAPPVSGANVTLGFTRPDGSSTVMYPETNEHGNYSVLFAPDMEGKWRVKAYWEGDSEHKGADSATQHFTVAKNPTSVSIEVSKRRITEGSSITISGSIMGVSNVELVVSFTKADGSTQMRTAIAGSDGSYSISYKPIEAGAWSVRSSWPGNASHYKATSSTLEFNVIPLTGVIEVLVEDEEGNKLSGATVSSTSQPLFQDEIKGTTGPDGVAVFSDVRVGDYTMQASIDGYYTDSGSVTAAVNETKALKIALEEQVGDLEVTVEDEDGNVVPEATVTSTSQPIEQPPLSGTTGSDGSVAFEDLKLGDYTFEVSKKGYTSGSVSAITEAGETTLLTICLEKKPSGLEAIPGFPYESVIVGLMIGAAFIWTLRRRS